MNLREQASKEVEQILIDADFPFPAPCVKEKTELILSSPAIKEALEAKDKLESEKVRAFNEGVASAIAENKRSEAEWNEMKEKADELERIQALKGRIFHHPATEPRGHLIQECKERGCK